MLKRLFSFIAPVRNKKQTRRVHTNHSNIHDSNEDILRIIKLYNQGTIKTINDEATLNGVKYPCLLKYRASNFYVFLTAALSIFTSVKQALLFEMMHSNSPPLLYRSTRMLRYHPSHATLSKAKSNQRNSLYKTTRTCSRTML